MMDKMYLFIILTTITIVKTKGITNEKGIQNLITENDRRGAEKIVELDESETKKQKVVTGSEIRDTRTIAYLPPASPGYGTHSIGSSEYGGHGSSYGGHSGSSGGGHGHSGSYDGHGSSYGSHSGSYGGHSGSYGGHSGSFGGYGGSKGHGYSGGSYGSHGGSSTHGGTHGGHSSHGSSYDGHSSHGGTSGHGSSYGGNRGGISGGHSTGYGSSLGSGHYGTGIDIDFSTSGHGSYPSSGLGHETYGTSGIGHGISVGHGITSGHGVTSGHGISSGHGINTGHGLTTGHGSVFGLSHGGGSGDYKKLALKGILIPLAGIALLGAAAALTTNPVLLQLGVLNGRRRRRSLIQSLPENLYDINPYVKSKRLD